MLQARQPPARALLAWCLLALVISASASQFTLFPTSEGSGEGGAAGNYTRYENTPQQERERGGAGPDWVGPVLGGAVVLLLVGAGAAWIRSRRRRIAEAEAVAVSLGMDAPAAPVTSARTGPEVGSGVERSWRQVELILQDHGVMLPASRTATSTGVLAVELGAPGRQVRELVRLYDRARYSGVTPDRAVDERANQLARDITHGFGDGWKDE